MRLSKNIMVNERLHKFLVEQDIEAYLYSSIVITTNTAVHYYFR